MPLRSRFGWSSTYAGIALLVLAVTAHAQDCPCWSLRKQLGLPEAEAGADNPIRLISQLPAITDLETAPAPRVIPNLPAVDPAQLRLVELAASSGNQTGPFKLCCVGENCPPMTPPPQGRQERWMCMLYHFSEETGLLCQDFKNMYLSWNVLGLGAALAVAAPLANTSADERFQTWYHGHVRGDAADHWGSVGQHFGAYGTVIPVVIVAAVGGALCPETHTGTVVGNWGDRSIRALVVGAPTVVILQVALGSGEPGSTYGSAWHYKQGHEAVAAEAFVGAVPFLTAASMTKIRPLRWALIGGSFIATWANIHNDSHYLSQSLLGWSIGAIATCSVNDTESSVSRVRLTPIALPQGVGAGVQISY